MTEPPNEYGPSFSQKLGIELDKNKGGGVTVLAIWTASSLQPNEFVYE